jgi:hypothetical protein
LNAGSGGLYRSAYYLYVIKYLLLRTVLAILLLTVHVFALGGYRLVFDYFEERADQSLIQKIDDHHYSEADLVTIKIPLDLPYINNRSTFERFDGIIRINGVFYNYVKRKLFNDTLILQCIANFERSKLQKENNQYGGFICSDLPSVPGRRAANSLLKFFFPVYNCKDGHNLVAPFFIQSSGHILPGDDSLYSCFIPLPAQPPETRSI